MEKREELLNFGNFPEMQGDGLGDVQFVGKTIQIYLFGWRRIDGVWRKVATGWAAVPTDSLPSENIARLRLEYDQSEEKRMAH